MIEMFYELVVITFSTKTMRIGLASRSCSKGNTKRHTSQTKLLQKNPTIDIHGLLKQHNSKRELQSVDNSVDIIDNIRQSRELQELRQIVSSESQPRIQGLIHDEFDSERIKKVFRQMHSFRIQQSRDNKVVARSSSLLNIHTLLKLNKDKSYKELNKHEEKAQRVHCLQKTIKKNMRMALRDGTNFVGHRALQLDSKQSTLKENQKNLINQILQSIIRVKSLTLKCLGYKNQLSSLSEKVSEYKEAINRQITDTKKSQAVLHEFQQSVATTIYFRAQYRRIQNETTALETYNNTAEPQNILLRAAKRSHIRKSIKTLQQQTTRVIKRVQATIPNTSFLKQFKEQMEERMGRLGQAAQISLKGLPQQHLFACLKQIVSSGNPINPSELSEIRDLCRENGIEF